MRASTSPKVRYQTKYVDPNPFTRYLIRKFAQRIARIIKDINPENILDAGCGEGVILYHLARAGLSGDSFTGIDIHQESLELAQMNNPKAHFQTASIYELPFSENTFDLVLCLEVLEHLEEPRKALEEIHRVAKRYALFSVPWEPLWRIANMLRGKYWRSFGNTPGHLNHWSRKQFVKLLSDYFAVRSSEIVGLWSVVLCAKI